MFKIKADSTYKGRLVLEGFCRSLVSTAVAPSLPRAGFRASARCSQLWWSWITRYTCWTCGRNFSTEFLNANVREHVFVKMAGCYETSDKAGVPLVTKLTKSLYGLQQSPINGLARWTWSSPFLPAQVGSVRIYLRG